MNRKPGRVCIIGAGSSGIVAAKMLHERNIPFDCFEHGSDIGGNWRYENDNEMSSAYASLHINTSRDRMAYADFPMPEDYPDFLHHAQVLQYFEDYVDHFGRTITKSRMCCAASGCSLWVCNSGCDIACESAKNANQTWISTRHGAHVVPRYILGRPLDTFTSPLISRLPLWMQRTVARLLLILTRGPQSRYGFPIPEHDFGAEHPTVSSDLLPMIREEAVQVKPNIEELSGEHVRFVDGSTEQVDLVIYATGYKMTFPFFDEDFIEAVDNRLPLYLNVVPPEIPSLYFIGLIQPLGAIMPLAEVQAEWVADLLEGKTNLPTWARMKQHIAATEEAMRARYVNSKRHTIQVDFYPYYRAIERERRAGRKRAPRCAPVVGVVQQKRVVS